MKLLNQIPKALLVSLIILGGIFYMIFTNPPHRFCDTQVENFKAKQIGYLYPDPEDFREKQALKEKGEKKKEMKGRSARLKRSYELCRGEARPGSCYEYFSQLRKLFEDLKLLTPECKQEIYREKEIKQAFKEALILMTALAFDEKAVTGKASRYSWLVRRDLNLFCQMKGEYEDRFGMRAVNALETEVLENLPLETKLSPEYLRKYTLFGLACAGYL